MAVEGWRRSSYGDLLTEDDMRAGDRVDLPVLSVTKSRGLMLAAERFGKVMHGRDLSRYRVARRGQIVADPMLLWDGAIGVQAVVEAGLVSPDYRVYTPTSAVDPEYAAYLVRSPTVLPYYQGGARGTNVRRNRIARSDFLRIPVDLPPLAEQRKIASILSSLDEAIEVIDAVIAQLQVVKKATMADLLTRGLPGRHTQFKETDAGQIPVDWAFARIRDVALLGSGTTPSRAVSEYFSTEVGLPWVKTTDLTNAEILTTEERVTQLALDEHAALRVYEPGTVFVAMYGGFAQIGRTGVLTFKAACNQALCSLTLNAERLLPGFCNYWLGGMRDRWRAIAASSRKDPNITKQDVGWFGIALPPIEEQIGIIQYLDAISERLRVEGETGAAYRAVKTALMSALLTGDLRVRPDESSEAAA